jgi:adenylate cyclase, class 2
MFVAFAQRPGSSASIHRCERAISMELKSATSPRRNVELKARLHDLAAARRLAAALSGGPPQILRQVDTYFRCAQGRLKLREFDEGQSELIAYVRPNELAPRASEYRLVPVADAAALCAALTETLGILIVVEKLREISLYKNVRIHVDQVQRLGTFLEFEAVLPAAAPLAEGERLVRELSGQFGLARQDLVAGSYSDLLLHSASEAAG